MRLAEKLDWKGLRLQRLYRATDFSKSGEVITGKIKQSDVH
jgi:hypothetical protein